MQIRNDLFPDNPKAKEIRQAFINITHSSLKHIFPTKEDVTEYVNNFNSPEIAFLFLQTGRYYNSVNSLACYFCFPPKPIDKCPNCGKTLQMPSFLALITMISIMEKLSSELKFYQDFYTWIGTEEAKKQAQAILDNSKNLKVNELINSLQTSWAKEYGSKTKVTEFFLKFLTREEKMQFIKSIRYCIELPELPPKGVGITDSCSGKELDEVYDNWVEAFEKEQKLTFETKQALLDYIEKNGGKKAWEALPICFVAEKFLECYSTDYQGHGQGYCYFNINCKLDNDVEVLDQCFSKTIKTIYEWRSNFVHNMTIPPIKETAMNSTYYDDKMILVELTTSELKPIFERMLKRYFDQFQKKPQP
jgi:hypothetical protein